MFWNWGRNLRNTAIMRYHYLALYLKIQEKNLLNFPYEIFMCKSLPPKIYLPILTMVFHTHLLCVNYICIDSHAYEVIPLTVISLNCFNKIPSTYTHIHIYTHMHLYIGIVCQTILPFPFCFLLFPLCDSLCGYY